MESIKFTHGIEIEHAGEGEYVLRLKTPHMKILSGQTGDHLKQAKKEVLLALRSVIDEATKMEEEKSGKS